jgi:hypothetical protein
MRDRSPSRSPNQGRGGDTARTTILDRPRNVQELDRLSLAIIVSEQKIVDVGAAAGHSAANAICVADGCGAPIRPAHAEGPPARDPRASPPARASSLVPIDASASLTACSGCACDGCGRGGARRWCWSSRRQSPAGIAAGFMDGGALGRDGGQADHASNPTSGPSFDA